MCQYKRQRSPSGHTLLEPTVWSLGAHVGGELTASGDSGARGGDWPHPAERLSYLSASHSLLTELLSRRSVAELAGRWIVARGLSTATAGALLDFLPCGAIPPHENSDDIPRALQTTPKNLQPTEPRAWNVRCRRLRRSA